MKHEKVVRLSQELGHGIHNLVGLTGFTRFHGRAWCASCYGYILSDVYLTDTVHSVFKAD